MLLLEIVELVKKNCRNLIRSKAGSLIVILGPLLVVFLAGLAFDNSNVYAVKVGVYRPDNASITARFVQQLKGDFKIQEFASEQECIDAVKNTDTSVCIQFAENFTVGVPVQNQITFYIDYSRINLVWAVRKAMSEKVDEVSLQVSENLTSKLLSVIEFTKKEVEKERDVVVRLTTENELVNHNTQDLLAELGDIDLSMDGAFPLENISSSRTQLKQWMENSLDLGDRGLSKAASLIDAADGLPIYKSELQKIAANKRSRTCMSNTDCSQDQICNGICIPKQQSETDCADELDNDRNGLIDCQEPQCAGQQGSQGQCCASNTECTHLNNEVFNYKCENNICQRHVHHEGDYNADGVIDYADFQALKDDVSILAQDPQRLSYTIYSIYTHYNPDPGRTQ